MHFCWHSPPDALKIRPPLIYNSAQNASPPVRPSTNGADVVCATSNIGKKLFVCKLSSPGRLRSVSCSFQICSQRDRWQNVEKKVFLTKLSASPPQIQNLPHQYEWESGSWRRSSMVYDFEGKRCFQIWHSTEVAKDLQFSAKVSGLYLSKTEFCICSKCTTRRSTSDDLAECLKKIRFYNPYF